jgi:hypothetical protein
VIEKAAFPPAPASLGFAPHNRLPSKVRSLKGGSAPSTNLRQTVFLTLAEKALQPFFQSKIPNRKSKIPNWQVETGSCLA